jgi:hypothetical protein
MAVVALVCQLIAALAPTGGTDEAKLALVRVRVRLPTRRRSF